MSVSIGSLMLIIAIAILGVQSSAPRLPHLGIISYHTSGRGIAGNIYLLDVGRTLKVPLVNTPTHDEYGADWSPDGSQVVYHADEGGGAFNLFMLDVTTGETRRLLTDRDDTIFGEWSPDGNAIVFQSGSTGYVLDLATDKVTEVPTQGTARNFSWSPDGEQLAYTSRDLSQIFTLDLSSGATAQVMDTGGSADFATWSPDGTRLLYRRTIDQPLNTDLFILDLETGDEERLTTTADSEMHSDWSLDGRYVVFNRIGWNGGNYDLFLLDTHTGEERQLTHTPSNENTPVWLPR